MALDQSQHASYKFGKTNFSKVAKSFRDRFNLFHDFSHAIALGLYDCLKENKVKEKNAMDFIYEKDIAHSFLVRKYVIEKGIDIKYLKVENHIIDLAIEEIYRKGDGKSILKPRRSAYPKITNKQKSFSIYIQDKDLKIVVNEKTLSVSWDISMNNRNVDAVNRSSYNYLFWNVLDNDVKWGRNEGGYCKTTEESNSDDPYDDRFNTHYSHYYGSLGKEFKEIRHKSLQARFT